MKEIKKYHNIILTKKILKSTNTAHRQYPRCYHRLCLQMDGGVEKVEAVEVGTEVVEAMHQMKNCHFSSARSSSTWSSSAAPQTISAASTTLYGFCGKGFVWTKQEYNEASHVTAQLSLQVNLNPDWCVRLPYFSSKERF